MNTLKEKIIKEEENTCYREVVKELEQCSKKWRVTVRKYFSVSGTRYVKMEIFNDKKQEYDIVYENKIDKHNLKKLDINLINIDDFN